MTDQYILYVSVALEKYHSPKCKHNNYIYGVFVSPSTSLHERDVYVKVNKRLKTMSFK